MNKEFWKGKRVFVTGHTGFKGAWLCEILAVYGAEVYGYALENPDEKSVYNILDTEQQITSCIGDIRDFDKLYGFFREVKPEIVFHLAAQPIVRESYKEPRYTYETNVMGTVNLLECVRLFPCVRSIVNVTTDKVYENRDTMESFSETCNLNGYDPYSNSKSCSELVTSSYRLSFLKESGVAVSTARAGNVIGGGDFSKDRIIPDCVRSAVSGDAVLIRNPHSIRPYQHVFEPLSAYMLIAEKQYYDSTLADCYNVGPEPADCVSTDKLADMFCENWAGAKWTDISEENAPHESSFLMLDCRKIKNRIGWEPKWNISHAVQKTVEWYKGVFDNKDMRKLTLEQIGMYFS